MTEAEEMTLGANQKLSEAKRFSWKTEKSMSKVKQSPLRNDFVVELTPMKIRTFVIKVQRN